jgi:hypothetical protein
MSSIGQAIKVHTGGTHTAARVVSTPVSADVRTASFAASASTLYRAQCSFRTGSGSTRSVL